MTVDKVGLREGIRWDILARIGQSLADDLAEQVEEAIDEPLPHTGRACFEGDDKEGFSWVATAKGRYGGWYWVRKQVRRKWVKNLTAEEILGLDQAFSEGVRHELDRWCWRGRR